MPYFDRFDICSAYYVFAVLYHRGMNSPEYKVFGRLRKLQFIPGLSIRNCQLEKGSNAEAIFQALVAKHNAGIYPIVRDKQ